MEMFHLRIFKYRNAYASEKDVRWNQPTYKRYDQCLVTWKFSSCTSSPDLQIITQNRLPKAFATVYPTVLLPQ